MTYFKIDMTFPHLCTHYQFNYTIISIIYFFKTVIIGLDLLLFTMI